MSLNKALKGMTGTLVLLFTVPIVASVTATIAADVNVDATTQLIVGFVGVLYSLGVLVFCVQSFMGAAQSRGRRG